MERREFLARSAGILGAASAQPVFADGPDDLAPATLTSRRVADDRFEVTFDAPAGRTFRILQITDTHFGTPTLDKIATDQLTRAALTALVKQVRPDFLFHTGDFINNDREGVTWEAIEFIDSLGVPWSHAIGNHDVGFVRNSLSIDAFRARMRGALVGHSDRGGKREYAFRIDIVRSGSDKARYSLFCLDSGFQQTSKHVSDGQIQWLGEQIDSDLSRGIDCPALTMVHIPVIQFEKMRQAGASTGHFGESVCFETDTGNTFEALKNARRVRAIFSGHDHENDYTGPWHGIELVYGRVSGWSGYGKLPRGGRLIEIDLDRQTYAHQIVLPRTASS